MRTTVEFDDDAARAIERLRREEGIGVSEAVNRLIRRGLLGVLDRDPVLVVPTLDDVYFFERELCAEGAVLGASVITFAGLFGTVATAAGALIRRCAFPQTVSQSFQLFPISHVFPLSHSRRADKLSGLRIRTSTRSLFQDAADGASLMTPPRSSVQGFQVPL